MRPTTVPAIVIACFAGALGSARPADATAAREAVHRVRVHILEKHAPRWLEFAGPQRLLVRASGDALSVDGAIVPTLDLPAGRWLVRGEGVRRTYEGALHLRAAAGAITAQIDQPLEAYVADVVTAESDPGTPAAALEALAIVVRSYARAAGHRHDDGALCDLAHCQVTAGGASAEARAAARATEGLVLVLHDGAIARAPFHAACGGHTADPAATFGGDDRTGAAAVGDPGCSAPWSASLPRHVAEAALAPLLGPQARISALRLGRGPGGFVDAVSDPRTGRRTSGEAFARALDRSAGWGVVRSPRFWLVPGDPVGVRGEGHGHGVGLCQQGAARRAVAGAGARQILAAYFPRARVERR